MHRILRKPWIFPVVLWLVLLSATVAGLSFGQRKFHSLPRALFQWDGQHYLSIADSGYEMYPCGFNVNWICGNVGWFPFYPMVGRAVRTVSGLDIRVTMLLVNWLAFLAALILLVRLVESRFGPRIGRTALAALIVFPSAFYYFAGFPYAIYLLLAVLTFCFLERERFWPAVVTSGCLAITYPSGLVIAIPVAWTLLSRWRQLHTSQRYALVAGVAAPGVALTLYATYYWWKFDDFFLYQRFQAQSFYAHEISFPFSVLYRSLTSLSTTSPEFIILAFVLLSAVIFYSRKLPVSWQLYGLAVLLFTPTFGTSESFYRHSIVIFPLFVQVGLAIDSRWRRYLLAIYGVVGVVLMWAVFLKSFGQGSIR